MTMRNRYVGSAHVQINQVNGSRGFMKTYIGLNQMLRRCFYWAVVYLLLFEHLKTVQNCVFDYFTMFYCKAWNYKQLETNQANTNRRIHVGVMLGRTLWRLSSIKAEFDQCHVFAENTHILHIYLSIIERHCFSFCVWYVSCHNKGFVPHDLSHMYVNTDNLVVFN